MGCEICGRSACSRCFHSLEAQEEFDTEQEKLRTMNKVMDFALNHIDGTTENDADEVGDVKP